jgi:hypothetical protein
MRRRTAKWTCTIIAAALAIAIIASFGWSFTAMYSNQVPRGRQSRSVTLGMARLTYVRHVNTVMSMPLPSSWNFFVGKKARDVIWTPWQVNESNGCLFFFPLWIPLLPVALPAGTLWLLDIRRARRERADLCKGCGYDRRGIPPGAACPECGTTPAT